MKSMSRQVLVSFVTCEVYATQRPCHVRFVLCWCQTDSVTAAGSMMLTVLGPRFFPNFTAPATNAKSVSSPPRPTPPPGWKCVPRWRTRISPALTAWPPKRLTPRYWEFESRPLRVEDAPFLCAMSVPAFGSGACQMRERPNEGGSGLDRGDLDLGRVLTVTLTLAVSGLVLELHDRDLGAFGGLDHLGGDLDLRELARVGGHGGSIDQKKRSQINAVAGLALHLVDDEDVADRNLFLTAACANDRVHVGLTLLRLFGEVATGNRHIVSEETRARWAHRGFRLLVLRPMNQTHRGPPRVLRPRGEARRVRRREGAYVERAREELSPRPPAWPQRWEWAERASPVARRKAVRLPAGRRRAGQSSARDLDRPRTKARLRVALAGASTSSVQRPTPLPPEAGPSSARWSAPPRSTVQPRLSVQPHWTTRPQPATEPSPAGLSPEWLPHGPRRLSAPAWGHPSAPEAREQPSRWYQLRYRVLDRHEYLVRRLHHRHRCCRHRGCRRRCCRHR